MNLQEAIMIMEKYILPTCETLTDKRNRKIYMIGGIESTQTNLVEAVKIIYEEAKSKLGRKIEPIEYNCTLSLMAEQIGIELWQAMEMGKYFKVKNA